MDEKEYLTEKLNSIRNEMSHIWGGIFVIGGGTFTLGLTTSYKDEKIILVLLGIFMTILFINAYMIRRDEIKDILKEIKKGGQ